MKSLFLIPARGGSKGIPYKNIKELAGKPLIHYSIEVAREITSDDNICVSTDDEKIIECVNATGLNVPFIRPDYLASDTAGTNDVICHAINYYKDKGIEYDNVVLLQPTSPLRSAKQVREAMSLYRDDLDMVVSVKKNFTSVVLFKENENGFLEHAFEAGKGVRRQDALKLYEYNGAIYVINCNSVLEKGMSNFQRIEKYVMSDETSVDIDNMLDWYFCETLINHLEK